LLDAVTKRRIDTCRDILVGKVPELIKRFEAKIKVAINRVWGGNEQT
jgi:hypothetical protein